MTETIGGNSAMAFRTQKAAAARAGGFTLIELMVVVAIVAILAAIALPNYTESVRKGRRGQAKADLVEAAQIMERWRTINGGFTGTVTGLPNASPKTGTPMYDIAFAAGSVTATTFKLTATPRAGSAQASDRCGVLSIDQSGAKQHSIGTDDECQFGTTGT